MPDLTYYNREGSIAETARTTNNSGPYSFGRNMSFDPKNIISIFTVNTREQYSSSAAVKYAGRGPKERYRKVGTINDPKYRVDDVSIEGQPNQKKVTDDDGRWEAMDALNPANVFTLDQNYVVPTTVDDGTNLLGRGLFFIVRPFDPINGNAGDTPTEDEIKPAEKRLLDRYNALAQKYNRVSVSDPKNLPNIMSEEMIDALNALGIKTPYNSILEQRTVCPTCGDMKLAAAKFHKSESLGVICIEPSPEGWRAAVQAGIKSKEDVPEEFKVKIPAK